MALFQQLHGLARPDGPVPQQPPDNPALPDRRTNVEAKRRQQIEHDGIVVARIEPRRRLGPVSTAARITSMVR